MNELDAIRTPRRSGKESFHHSGSPLDICVRDFWRWASSDLLSNAMRGVVAEFLVASACKVSDTVRVEWDSVDLITSTGIRVEVKSGAFIQSWQQKSLSQIRFGIEPKYGWDAATNTAAEFRSRSSDVYVFCVLSEVDQCRIDPLDLDQWEFYVAATVHLSASFGEQKTVGLRSLQKKLSLEPTKYLLLADVIERMSAIDG